MHVSDTLDRQSKMQMLHVDLKTTRQNIVGGMQLSSFKVEINFNTRRCCFLCFHADSMLNVSEFLKQGFKNHII